MSGKNRRVSEATAYRYFLKRLSINLGTAGHSLSEELAENPKVLDEVIQRSAEELNNWYIAYAPYHKVKEIVKDIAQRYSLPSRIQGLLMAYAEKIVANWYIDFKGESLVDMLNNYAAKLQKGIPRVMGRYPYQSAGTYFTYKDKFGKTHTVSIVALLREITVEVLRTIGLTEDQIRQVLTAET